MVEISDLSKSECTNPKLRIFSFEHFTYINQIFGDQTIREIIREVFPNKKYLFGVQQTGEEFENSHHHVLIEKKTNAVICSGIQGYQNLSINKNDTLCQSYSLLNYFSIPINPDQKQRQLDMISMYRNILSNKKFLKKIDQIIDHPDNSRLWIDTTVERDNDYILMDKEHILEKINNTLNVWEQYGYWYFIGDGKCPNTKKRKRVIGGKTKQQRTNNKSVTHFLI